MAFDGLMWIRASWPPGFSGDPIGYVASGLVLLTFTMKSMRPLRIAAISSNFAFIYYAIVAGVTPVLILHLVLLPMNVFRLLQIEERARSVRPSGTAGIAAAFLVFVVLAFGLSHWTHSVPRPGVAVPDWPLGSI